MTQSIVDTARASPSGSEGASAAGATLVPLSELEFTPDDLARIGRSIERKGSASVGNVWGAAQALVTASIADHLGAPLLAIVSTDGEAENLVLDLAAFGVGTAPLPSKDTGGKNSSASAIRRSPPRIPRPAPHPGRHQRIRETGRLRHLPLGPHP